MKFKRGLFGQFELEMSVSEMQEMIGMDQSVKDYGLFFLLRWLAFITGDKKIFRSFIAFGEMYVPGAKVKPHKEDKNV